MATPITEYGPFDSGPGADWVESDWRAAMKHVLATGVLWGARGEFKVFADSTGMQVKVPSGECWIQGHWGMLETQATVPIAAANATNPRKDLVVLRANFLGNVIEWDVLTGTPAATPVEPSLTRNTSVWEIPLAVVTVAAGASTIAAGNVYDARTMVAEFGWLFGHAGRTGGFQAIGPVTIESAQEVSGGVAYSSANSGGLRVPIAGTYQVSVRGYLTGSGTGRVTAQMRVNGVGDNRVGVNVWKGDGNDYRFESSALVRLAAGDVVGMLTAAPANVTHWGTDGYNGCWVEVLFVGP